MSIDFETIQRRAERHRAFCDLLKLLTAGNATPHQVGARTLLLAHCVGALGDESKQKHLAKRLGVSSARVSQALNFLRPKLQEIGEKSESAVNYSSHTAEMW